METLLGFQISGWDYLTFLVIFIIGVAFFALVIFVLGLPGRIAIARNHPEADAVNAMGWAGFLAVVPWISSIYLGLQADDGHRHPLFARGRTARNRRYDQTPQR